MADVNKIDFNDVEKKVVEKFNEYSGKATEMLKNADQVEGVLQRVEEKLRTVPKIGEELAEIPTLIAILRAYICKEYAGMDRKSVVAIMAALLYLVSPVDIIPDGIPLLGIVDDAIVIGICLKYVAGDVEKYRAWRASRG